jgi:membrane-bound ClpP family serine protease
MVNKTDNSFLFLHLNNKTMKTLTIKSLSGLLMLVGLLPLLVGCAPGVNIFKTGYWATILVVGLVLLVIAYMVFRFSNSGTEHKS